MNRKVFFALMVLAGSMLFTTAKAQVLISGFMANPPTNNDAPYEYVQLIATETVNFANTPYSVVWANNGTANASGWVQGGTVTYGFNMTSGTVNKGDVFYVGGDGKLISGAGSTDISTENWVRAINTSTTTGDGGLGTNGNTGQMGNGGFAADGIAVFAGTIQNLTASSIPVDAVFYGSAVGTARPATGGYTLPDNDHYSNAQGTFGNGTNTFLLPNPLNGGTYLKLSGTYFPSIQKWDIGRTGRLITLTTTSALSTIATGIVLDDPKPGIYLSAPATNTGISYIAQGSANNVIQSYKITVQNMAAILDTISLNIGGTFTSADISKIKIIYSADDQFQSTDTIIKSVTGVNPGVISFNTIGFTLDSASNGYLLVAADVNMSANTTGDTIYVKESYFKNFIFRTARYYGKDTMAASVKKVIVDYGTGIISTTYLNDFGPVDVGTNSAEQSFTISGTDLSPSRFVRIYPNPGFLISLTSGSGYSSSYIDKSYTSTTLAPTKVFVVFSPLAYNKINSTLKITGATGANDMFVPVSGTGTCGDHTPPRVDSAMAVSSTSVLVYFSEAVDNTAELNNSYLFNPTLTIASVVRSASLKVATITLTTPIAVGTTYTLGVRNVIRDTCINHNVMTTLQTFPIRYGTVKITNHNISEVTSVNATTGQTDSLNVYCRLTGVIQSQNFSQNVNNSMFYIHDNTDGILINRTGAVPVFQVRRGDKVRAMGRIQQVNGLTRLTADSIVVMDSFQQQRTPSVVLKLNESTEAEVNRINNLRLINPLQWPVTAGATRNVQATNGTDTFTITIFTRCNIQGTPAPAGLFDISGLGSQNDNSLPYTTGYTIWPRDLNDLNIHPPYPTYTIAEVHSENAATGFADSAGIYCQLIGVVHGNNESSTGLSFTIIDKTGGIKVFSSVYNGPFYFVTEGDEVAVTGTIQQYNGLTEIYPDTVTLLMPAQTLSTPQPVDNLDESTESKLVQIKNLTIVPPSQWPVSAVNNAVDVEVTDGTHNYLVRINKNCDIQGTPVPVGKFDVTGIGAQFDPTDPFTGQYYIVPRYQADITVSNGISNNDLLNKVNLFPNPSSGSFFIQNGTKISLDVEVFNTTGKLVYRNSSEQQLQKIELPGASGLYLVKITDPKTSISKTFKVELK